MVIVKQNWSSYIIFYSILTFNSNMLKKRASNSRYIFEVFLENYNIICWKKVKACEDITNSGDISQKHIKFHMKWVFSKWKPYMCA